MDIFKIKIPDVYIKEELGFKNEWFAYTLPFNYIPSGVIYGDTYKVPMFPLYAPIDKEDS